MELPALIQLDQEHRDGHAKYNQLRALGVPKERIPKRVKLLEQGYQRARHIDRKRNQAQEGGA